MSKILLAKIRKTYTKIDSISPAKEIYAMTKEVEGYSGHWAIVKETGGNTEKPIYFDINGEVDTVTLLDHCGSNNGLVKNWGGQKGFSDAVQSDDTKCPKIVIAGVLQTENGKPCIRFDNTDDFLEADVPYAVDESVVSMISLYTRHTSSELDIVIGSSPTSSGMFLNNNSSDKTQVQTKRTATTSVNGTKAITTGTTVLTGAIADRTNIKIYENGALDVTSADTNTDFVASTKFTIGATGTGTFAAGSTYQFVGFWLSDQSSNMAQYDTELKARNSSDTVNTINVASSTYVTGTSGDMANTVFVGNITKSISIEKELGFFVFGNQSQTTISDLVFANDGIYDELLNNPVRDQSVIIEVIEEGAAYSTAVQVGEFIIDNVTNKDDDSITIKLATKLSLLDRNTIHSYFPATLPFVNNQEQPIPIAIGEVTQVAMPVVDDVQNRYHLTPDPVVGTVKFVKDRADPLVLTTGYTIVDIAETGGSGINLANNPNGTITASYIADDWEGISTKAADGFVGKLVIENLGIAHVNIDLVSLFDIDDELLYSYGIYIKTGTNVKQILDSLAVSYCGFHYQANNGKIVFDWMRAPSVTATTDIDSIGLASGIKVSIDTAPGLSDAVTSKKNWHVFGYDDVRDIDGLSEDDKQIVSSEFVNNVRADTTLNNQATYHQSYAHARNGDYINTLSVNVHGATGLLSQQATLYDDARYFYDFDFLSDDVMTLLELELNDTIKLTHNRYGLDAGKNMRLVKIKIKDILKNESQLVGWA